MSAKNKTLLSVVLAVRNEEKNLSRCLASVTSLHPEIVVVDGESSDKTVEIARKFGARVIAASHEVNFHINKQKALEAASGEWVLLLDADEALTPELSSEIAAILPTSEFEIRSRCVPNTAKRLFLKHQRLIEIRDSVNPNLNGETVAFYVPRRNMFMGKPLLHGGSYPDGVIRLFKRGRAHLPHKDVHEQPVVDGRTDWLYNDLLHYDSPTFSKYVARANRYTNLTAEQLFKKKVALNFFNDIQYLLWLPAITFLRLFLRHKGYKDGFPGLVWALFSALHFALAYMKLRDLYTHAHSH